MHPLHALYSAVFERDDKPKKNFLIEFRYPSEEISVLGPLEFQTLVVWRERERKLIVDTAIKSIQFPYWEGLEHMLDLLNVEMRPYLDVGRYGSLRAAQFVGDDLLVPTFHFVLQCHSADADVLKETFFQLLYRGAARSLLLTRTVFAFVNATGQEPDAVERMRLLSLEHGRFHVALKTGEEEGPPPTMLPEGFFLYQQNRRYYAPDPSRSH